MKTEVHSALWLVGAAAVLVFTSTHLSKSHSTSLFTRPTTTTLPTLRYASYKTSPSQTHERPVHHALSSVPVLQESQWPSSTEGNIFPLEGGVAAIDDGVVAPGVTPSEALAFNLASLGLLAGYLWSMHGKVRRETLALAGATGEAADAGKSAGGAVPSVGGIDFALLAYFFFWYLGNYYYNIYNKVSLNLSGGAAGFPLTVAAAQLFFAALYPMFLWLAPDARPAPKITMEDVKAMLPVSLCAAGAHCSSVFALGAGAVSFAQIVKAAEPAFAAVLGSLFYGSVISTAKWICLLPVIGGVALASAKELDFAWSALFAAAVANLFAAVKGNENKKLMETRGITERLGSVGNQFAVTSLLSFLMTIPLILLREASSFPAFLKLFMADPVFRFNIIASGLVFYAYNELATLTIAKTSAVTQSVANTAKRVIVIVGVAIVLKESLDPLKLLGCAIGIGGVFLYSVIDSFVKPKPAAPAA